MAVSLLLLAVDYQTLWVDPDARNKKDDAEFLNRRVRLYNLVLGYQFFSSIICLRHVRSKVFSTDIGLPWNDPVGLFLLYYLFGNKVFLKFRLNKV